MQIFEFKLPIHINIKMLEYKKNLLPFTSSFFFCGEEVKEEKTRLLQCLRTEIEFRSNHYHQIDLFFCIRVNIRIEQQQYMCTIYAQTHPLHSLLSITVLYVKRRTATKFKKKG